MFLFLIYFFKSLMSLWGVNSFFIHLIVIDRVSGGRHQEPQIKQTRALQQGGAGSGQIRSRGTVGGMGINSVEEARAGGGTGTGKVTSERGPGETGRAGRSLPPLAGSFSAVGLGGPVSSSKSQEEEGHPLSRNFQVHELVFDVRGRVSGLAAWERWPGLRLGREMSRRPRTEGSHRGAEAGSSPQTSVPPQLPPEVAPVPTSQAAFPAVSESTLAPEVLTI